MMQSVTGKKNWKTIFVRSLLTALCVWACLFATQYAVNGIMVASIGSSAFVAFAFPRTEASKPKYLVGGYACGIVAGLAGYGLCRLLSGTAQPYDFFILTAGVGLSVFFATFLMLALSLRHPPAAALAISIAIDSKPLQLSAIAIACIIVIAAIKMLQLYITKRKNGG